MSKRPYDLFMSAFNDIEAHLTRSLYGSGNGAPGLRKMLDEYQQKKSRHLRRSQYDSLLLFAELRNTLTHSQRLNDEPLAEPTEAAIEAIRRLRDEMLHPKTMLGALRRDKAVTVPSDTSVREVLSSMYENDFSQVPVYDDATYVGLLTTNTVARWVADQFKENDGLAEDAPVAEVLKFAEGNERVLHLPRELTTTEAVWRFTTAGETGESLTAIILTHNGKKTEAPLAIVVDADIAALSQH